MTTPLQIGTDSTILTHRKKVILKIQLKQVHKKTLLKKAQA